MTNPTADRLRRRVALVTGGARGLGEGIVRRLSAEGACAIIGDVREDIGAALAAELGVPARFHRLDVTSEESWDAAVAAAVEEYGRIDVLVNNAGVGGPTPITETTLADYERIIAVNQTGVFLGMRACVPVMIGQGHGSIVNVASIEGLRGLAGFTAYCGAKHAVVGMTRAVSLELASAGVRVNAICPGAIDTPGLFKGIGGAAGMEKLAAAIPQRRLAPAAEVASLVAFLASDDANYCTGGDYVVDGGWTAGTI
jgi:3alpha(or 20beta)-hydroxysteroid dehydrogenase